MNNARQTDNVSIIRPFMEGEACIKIRKGLREISIACDDSCGALPNYSRSDIRCYQYSEDGSCTNVTADVFNDASYFPGYVVILANMENLSRAMAWANS